MPTYKCRISSSSNPSEPKTLHRWTVEASDVAEAVERAMVRMEEVLPADAAELRYPDLLDDATVKQRMWGTEEGLMLLTVRRKDNE
jgi:hypothetical protein